MERERLQKHLLLTVSEDASALYGAQFVSGFFTRKEDIAFTLLFIAPRTEAQPRISFSREEEATCNLAMEKTMLKLSNAGFLQENVQCKVQKRTSSAAKDIIQEGNRGLYDAIVLGRRGISRFEELIGDSVSIQALEGGRQVPVWICRRPEEGRRNVLVCIDGSEDALRAADHAGYILSGQDHGVTLLHVAKKDAEVSEDLFERPKEVLAANEIAPDRIEEKVLAATDPAKAIEREAREGGYSAVAAGYSGKGRSGLFTIGSVSKKLIYTLQGSVLWIG
jgi:nucleotide-binding universal stress UspA family protein